MLRTGTVFCAALWATLAHAGAADEYLEKMDTKANSPQDTWFRFSAVTQEPGKTAREMIFEVQNQGEKRLVNFEGPPDMKGTRVLVLSRQQMWVYLPAYRKVRRVASHVKQQGFMGTTYSDEDMSTTHYGAAYSGEVVQEDDKSITLKLNPKAETKTSYGHLQLDIRKDLMLPSELRYYNPEGQHVKTESRSEYDCEADVCTPSTMKMTDHTRNDAWTSLNVQERKVNQGVSASVFSVRNLERGR
jgi:hypothetical protein